MALRAFKAQPIVIEMYGEKEDRDALVYITVNN
jgi:hypothetical protein